jgi:hypothetical protein
MQGSKHLCVARQRSPETCRRNHLNNRCQVPVSMNPLDGAVDPTIQGIVSAAFTGTNTVEFQETRRGRNEPIQGNFDPSSACFFGLSSTAVLGYRSILGFGFHEEATADLACWQECR